MNLASVVSGGSILLSILVGIVAHSDDIRSFEPLSKRYSSYNFIHGVHVCLALLGLGASVMFVVNAWTSVDAGLVLLPSVLAWLGLLGLLPMVHKPIVAQEGGHLGLCLVAVAIMGSLIIQSVDFFEVEILPLMPIVLMSVQGFAALVIFLMAGFFSDATVGSPIENVSHENGASVFSRLTFQWLNTLVVLGNKRPLVQSDLWELIEGDTCKVVIKKYLIVKQKHPKSTIFWNVLRVVYRVMLFQCACAFLSAVLVFAGPFFLFQIVPEIEKIRNGESPLRAWLMLLGLLGSILVRAMVDGQLYFSGRRVGTRIRSILVAELYRKSLKRAEGSQGEDGTDGQASLGKIVTLMSVDTERIRQFASYAHGLLLQDPLSLMISIIGLFFILEWSAFTGLFLILLLGPISSFVASMLVKVQDEMLSNTDSRVSAINEMLQGIRIIKYFAWESHFAQRIREYRNKELQSIIKLWLAWVGFMNVGQGGGIIISVATFATYCLVFGKKLDSATAFTAINLLKTVTNLMFALPADFMMALQAKVSIDRISGFLDQTELEKYREKEVNDANESDDDDATAMGDEVELLAGFVRASYSYYSDSTNEVVDIQKATEKTPLLAPSMDEAASNSNSQFVLRNLDIEFPIGGLTLIAGSTGSGKSSLLLGLLGEMRQLAGRHYLPDPREAVYDPSTGMSNGVAYVAQTAWLINATIRDNILFGQEYNEDRYRRVIHACALVKDFETLEGGDLTEIGEKGVNVSGGQKQRISLARACYSPASFILLDDPLSAVDAPTARHLLLNCILDEMKGRTCILVSHAVNLVLPHADYVIGMRNGTVLFHGLPSDLVQDPDAEGVFNIDLTLAETEEEEKQVQADVATASGSGTQLVDDEQCETGSVPLSLYYSYFVSAGGFWFMTLLAIALAMICGSTVVNDWWLRNWTDHNEAMAKSFGISSMPAFVSGRVNEMSNSISDYTQRWSAMDVVDPATGAVEKDDVLYYILMYTLFGSLVILVSNIQVVITLIGSYMASVRIHEKLLKVILRAPLRFFETTPIGRILNRFSKDIDSIDNNVMNFIDSFLQKVLSGMTILVVIGSVTPMFLLFAIPIVAMYGYVARVYLNSSRELKRLESISRSPLYAQFSETLTGVSTIRAYGAEKRFMDSNEKKVDLNHTSFFYMWAANRWLCFRTDILSGFIVFMAGAAILTGKISSGWAAMILTYSLDFTNALLWTVRCHADMEMAMNSCERLDEYMLIEPEAPEIIEDNRPADNWPAHGKVDVKNLCVRYALDQPDVLHDVSFNVQPGENVGVVGRTGAGKSTMSLSFFRILPLSGGSIEIDGVDISTIGLYDLRSRLTIIPQDPVLFQGTLRSNLDPLNVHDDATIWKALKSVHILDSFQTAAPKTSLSSTSVNEDEAEDGSSTITPSAFGGPNSVASSMSLEYPVSENGANFSQGQRQLLCLARALLRSTSVILLDEATASVDVETDGRIQETIRDQFAKGTVICIAHRLRTIIDYDKVLVLDKGRVLEFGSPYYLIEKSNVNAFRKMCEETGEFEELRELARSAEIARISKRSSV